jgi:hypothetical protein
MEAQGNSRAMETATLALPAPRSQCVRAPKDYFLGPVFAATKQTGRREVTIGDRQYIIGGFHPLRENFCPPALDVRHARAIFTLLSFRSPFDDTREIRFAFNEFCRRYANSRGGRYMRAIKEIVGELMDSYIQVTDLRTKLAHSYRLIERVEIRGRAIGRKDSRLATSGQTELKLNLITLSPEFYGLLNRIAELQDLKLHVFTSIRSPLAQAIYLYIPSRSVHHSENDPFEITLTKLFEQVSFPIPAFKSKRKEIFTKHSEQKRAIIQQLNGVETLTGHFKVKIVETTDGSDFKLQTWVEQDRTLRNLSQSNSKLITAYLESGRPRAYLDQALAGISPLSDYETDLLRAGNIEIEKNRRFFELAKALLKETRFVSLLAEAKGDELEGKKAIKNPTARLIHRIMTTIAAPANTPPTRA